MAPINGRFTSEWTGQLSFTANMQYNIINNIATINIPPTQPQTAAAGDGVTTVVPLALIPASAQQFQVIVYDNARGLAQATIDTEGNLTFYAGDVGTAFGVGDTAYIASQPISYSLV